MATESVDGSSPWEQHLQMTLEFIRAKESLDIIVFLSRMNTLGPTTGPKVMIQPSWVPNWLHPDTWADQRIKAYLRGKIFYRSVTHGCVNGRRSWDASRQTKPSFRITGRRLQCKGILIDTIYKLTTTYHEDDATTTPDFSSRSPVLSRSDSPCSFARETGPKTPPSFQPGSTSRVSTECQSEGNAKSGLHGTRTLSPELSGTREFGVGGVSFKRPDFEDYGTDDQPPCANPQENETGINKASVYMALFHLLNYHIYAPVSGEPDEEPSAEEPQVPFACEHIAFLSIFANLKNWKTIKSTVPQLARWIKLNRHFPIKRGGECCDELVLSDYLRHPPKSLYEFLERKHLDDSDVRLALLRTLKILASGRRLSLTKRRGYLGWVPAASQKGDAVALLAGCTVPVVLRPCPAGGFIIVGDSHFHGLMDGNVMDENYNVAQWPYIDIY